MTQPDDRRARPNPMPGVAPPAGAGDTQTTASAGPTAREAADATYVAADDPRLPADTADAARGDVQRRGTPTNADRDSVPSYRRAGASDPPIARRYLPEDASAIASRVAPGPFLQVRDTVRWGPIVAGLMTAVTSLILLSLLAVALGLSVAPTSTNGSQGDVLSLAAAATATLVGIVAFFIGGVVAARTAAIEGRGAGALNGFLVWALGVVLILALASMGLGAILGAAGNVVGATGMPSVGGTPNVSPGQIATIGRNSAIGALVSLAIPAIAAAIGGALGARSELHAVEE